MNAKAVVGWYFLAQTNKVIKGGLNLTYHIVAPKNVFAENARKGKLFQERAAGQRLGVAGESFLVNKEWPVMNKSNRKGKNNW